MYHKWCSLRLRQIKRPLNWKSFKDRMMHLYPSINNHVLVLFGLFRQFLKSTHLYIYMPLYK